MSLIFTYFIESLRKFPCPENVLQTSADPRPSIGKAQSLASRHRE